MVCDDHVMVRGAIADQINTLDSFFVCGEASTGDECINLIEKGNVPDILILDVAMPNGKNGYQVAKYLKEYFPDIKIIILSMINSSEAAQIMFGLGVRGYILKDGKKDELYLSMNKVSQGGIYFDSSLHIEHFENESDICSPSDWINRITLKELTLARLMNSDMAYKEIAAKLGVSENTIDNRRKKLFLKTGTRSRYGLIQYFKKMGFI